MLNNQFKIDDKISISGKYVGTIKYVGNLKNKKDIWLGIKLDKPNGHNNGTFEDVKYFDCEENHGVFVKAKRLDKSSRVLSEEEILSLDGAMNVSLLDESDCNKSQRIDAMDNFSNLYLSDRNRNDKNNENIEKEYSNSDNNNTEESDSNSNNNIDNLKNSDEYQKLKKKYEKLKMVNDLQKNYFLTKIGNYKKILLNFRSEYDILKNKESKFENIKYKIEKSDKIIKESNETLDDCKIFLGEILDLKIKYQNINNNTNNNNIYNNTDIIDFNKNFFKMQKLLKIIIEKSMLKKDTKKEMEEYKKLLKEEGIEFEIPNNI